MPSLENYGARPRHDFSKIHTNIPIPNLLEVQRASYEQFLQMGMTPAERREHGLQAAFGSVFPIEDVRGTCSLRFVSFTVGDWSCKCGAMKGLAHLRMTCRGCGNAIDLRGITEKEVLCRSCGTANLSQLKKCGICDEAVDLRIRNSVEECQTRGLTYSTPLKVTFRLEIYDVDEATKARRIRDIKEEEVFFGDLPLMTEKGTFIINGTERVVVSQLHRSPGVFFQPGPTKGSFIGKVIPYRGSWVEFEYDNKDLLYVRIDRKRRFLASVFLRALGFSSNREMVDALYSVETVALKDGTFHWKVKAGGKLSEHAVHARAVKAVKVHGESLVDAGKKVGKKGLKDLEKHGIESFETDLESLEGAVAATDIVDLSTGEVIIPFGGAVSADDFQKLAKHNVEFVELLFPEREDGGPVLLNTILKCNVPSLYPDRDWSLQEKAFVEFYRKMRPGDPPTLEGARNLFHMMFFDPKRYDFSAVGRLKFNTKLGTHHSLDDRVLSPEDYLKVVRYTIGLRKNVGTLDDIDHLGNRRVRSVGELLENQIRIGLVRMERAVKERMSVYPELATAMPRDLINAKPVIAAIFEFFGSSQLSQFMDQTNPLSEITHKRRLSALGPGGLSRERAGFEVRDVHTSHYGRICPIETPEGPNIGLISSLATFARINEFGFIESPYLKVENGRVLRHVRIIAPGGSDYKVNDVVEEREFNREAKKLEREGKRPMVEVPHAFYLTAWEEEQYIIAQANAPLDENRTFIRDHVQGRKAGEPILSRKEEINYIDVSPKQLVSIAASLIPFLEHDDANRALMGSNMQRQAVPLVRPKTPLVGTGMEAVAARDSGSVIVARRGGRVEVVDGTRIIVRVGAEEDSGYEFGADVYKLTKFRRSNQSTCLTQRPLVKVGQIVKGGQVLADGPCTDGGELALGQNILVAFMPWRGYNYEDAILISERLVREDVFTSIHIEEFEIEARDTKLGKEEITRDIPNISEVYLANLDESGIIHIGARVKPGDILVGKVTPKGETQLTPEEKLLRAIFGEKSAEYRDASLYTPPGIEGTVVDVNVFTRRGEDKDARTQDIENELIDRMEKDLEDQIRIIKEELRNKILDMLDGKPAPDNMKEPESGEILVKKGDKIRRRTLQDLDLDVIDGILAGRAFRDLVDEIRETEERTRRRIDLLRKEYQDKIDQMAQGDDLAPGVIKSVKVFIAMKRKIQVGDKMAGRHGNKGVVSRVLPEEDMPFLADGTPVDIVLNPLGVPSRMNVGQILETHLGWAARALGLTLSTSVFDGAAESDIQSLLKKAELPGSGKVQLRDGKTGQGFLQKVTVGVMYMMKLAHMVDDKIHARSIGPYSLITQQPLGGKAQFGGQRFGEMEVWALEAYGAANILQEILTVKSDDVTGRTKMYETIVKGEPPEEPGLPESFNVLVKELQGLGLNVRMHEREAEVAVAAETEGE